MGKDGIPPTVAAEKMPWPGVHGQDGLVLCVCFSGVHCKRGLRGGRRKAWSHSDPVLVLHVICSDSAAEAQKMSSELVGERDREWV